jgi:Uma2 family endonuclease
VLTAAKRTTVSPRIRHRHRLGPYHAGLRVTPLQFDAATFDEETPVRYELIDGILVVTPMPLPQERDPNEELGYELRKYQKEHPEGKALDKTLPEHEVRCGKDRRRADRVIWAGLGKRPHPEKDFPTIIVEFVSEGRRNWLRDYQDKRDEYLAMGVKEYWVFDRFSKSLTVYQATASGYRKKLVKSTQVYTTPLLIGFELSLGKLLKIAEEWE